MSKFQKLMSLALHPQTLETEAETAFRKAREVYNPDTDTLPTSEQEITTLTFGPIYNQHLPYILNSLSELVWNQRLFIKFNIEANDNVSSLINLSLRGGTDEKIKTVDHIQQLTEWHNELILREEDEVLNKLNKDLESFNDRINMKPCEEELKYNFKDELKSKLQNIIDEIQKEIK